MLRASMPAAWPRRAGWTHPGETIALVHGVMDSLYRAASRVALERPTLVDHGDASINRLLYTRASRWSAEATPITSKTARSKTR